MSSSPSAATSPARSPSGQWYFQRYVEQLPTAGEIVLFDRSWYNRAGVEWVMGFCTKQEHQRFLHQCPIFERLLVEDGVLLRKYWFSVSDAEQEQRFKSRLSDPMRQWKLSPMDLESITRWEDYSRGKDEMFVHTDIPEAPWYVVEADDKRRARLNMIAHLLSSVPYVDVRRPPLALPRRPPPAAQRLRAHPPGDADLRPRPRRDPGRGRRHAARQRTIKKCATEQAIAQAPYPHEMRPGSRQITSSATDCRVAADLEVLGLILVRHAS
jgi:polyphosphate kinase 2